MVGNPGVVAPGRRSRCRARDGDPADASPEAFADFFLTNYGPTHAAAARLDDAGKTVLRDDLVRMAQQADRGLDGTLVSDWGYLVVTAEKR